LILATALSQQPFLKREGSGGQHFYRPRDFEALLQSLGIQARSVLPVMTHQFALSFSNQADADRAQAKLEALTCGGKQVFDFAPANEGNLYVGCQIYSTVLADAILDMGNGTAVPFFDLFYALGALKSGCHHPDGAFWIKSGKHEIHKDKLPIVDVLPMLLRHYGVSGQRDGAVRTAGSLS
jgi:hypothetical protein